MNQFAGLRRSGLALALFASALGLCACTKGSGESKAAGPAGQGGPGAAMVVPVTIGQVRVKSVPVRLTAPGTVMAYSTIAVKAQVGGELTKVFFKEGDEVKAGDSLFTIDPRPLAAALHQAEADRDKAIALQRQLEANLTRDQASAATAKAEAERYEQLVNEGVVSRSEYDKVRTEAETGKASTAADQAGIQSASQAVRAAEAAIENAKVQMGFTEIRAPITGRTGDLQVDEGNLIKSNADTPMVTINQISPIYISFSVPEQKLPQIKRYMAEHALKVTARAPNDDGPPAVGELTFMDNQVSPTHSILLKATFPNENRQLWPGQYVNVTMTLTVRPNLVVVPAPAVQAGQQGSYVYVVKPDQTTEMRPVKVGDPAGRDVIVIEGLKPGEQVVTDGQLRLTPGAKVKDTSPPQPNTPVGLTSDQPAGAIAESDADDTTGTVDMTGTTVTTGTKERAS